MKIAVFFAFLILTSFSSSAYAFPGFDGGWGFFDDLKRVSQSIDEAITFDPVEKQEKVLKNMAYWQSAKEKLVSDNKPVPEQYNDIITAKKNTIEKINTNSTSALTSIVDTILIAQELGKIQSYVDRFHDLKAGDVSEFEKSDLIKQLEKDVNQLSLVKKHCMPVSVNVLLSVEEPYDSIIEFCPVLKSIPKSIVMSTLEGD